MPRQCKPPTEIGTSHGIERRRRVRRRTKACARRAAADAGLLTCGPARETLFFRDMAQPMSDSPPDPYRDLFGMQLDAARLTENLAAFHDILREIQKLRQLDLTDVSPALVFEPTAPYRTGGEK